jgi:hypothetical protein
MSRLFSAWDEIKPAAVEILVSSHASAFISTVKSYGVYPKNFS